MDLEETTMKEEEKHLFADVDSSTLDEDAPSRQIIPQVAETSEMPSRRSLYTASFNHEPSNHMVNNAYFINRYQENPMLFPDGWGAD